MSKGMTSYEKIKKYDALLQRYLTLIKQGQIEEPRMTVTYSVTVLMIQYLNPIQVRQAVVTNPIS